MININELENYICSEVEEIYLEKSYRDGIIWEEDIDSLEKARQAAPVGTIKRIGNVEYIKTPEGWRYHTKGQRKKAQDHYSKQGGAMPAHLNGDIGEYRKNNGGHTSFKIKEGSTITAKDGTKGEVISHDGQNATVKYKTPDGEEKTVKIDAQKLEHNAASGNIKHEPGKDVKIDDAEPDHEDHETNIVAQAENESKPEPVKEENPKKEAPKKETKPREESKDTHEKRGFDEKKGDEDVTGKSEKIPAQEAKKEEEKINKENEKEEGFSMKNPEPATTPDSKKEDGNKDAQEINKKFETFGRYARGVVNGRMKSMIAYGSGGVGKTYTITQELKKAGKKIYDPEIHKPGDDDYDYVKITGKMTAAAVYENMYKHNGKILLFDDCDSVLQDENAINLFKGALDTSGDGSIDWGSKSKIKDDEGNPLPSKFAFSGRAMFISNLDIQSDKNKSSLQPIVSRGFSIDLSMTPDQTIDRIEHIAQSKDGKLTNLQFPGIEDYTHEDMKEVLDYMRKNSGNAKDLNVRTVGALLGIKKEAEADGVDWKEDAKHHFLKGEQIDIFNGGLLKAQQERVESIYKSQRNTSFEALKKAMKDNITSKEHKEDMVEKSEGSRGGKIIGHTKTGKAIYQNKNAYDHIDYNKQDHIDAFHAHAKIVNEHKDKNTPESTYLYSKHSKIAETHHTKANKLK